MKKLFAVLYTFVITLGTLWPASGMSRFGFFAIPNFDKILHLFGYLMLAFLWFLALEKPQKMEHFQKYILIGTIFFGIILEFAQKKFSLGRNMEVMDMVANAIGVFLGYFCYKFLYKKY